MNETRSSEGFIPLLTSYDWNEEWKALQKLRRHADNASYWDKRSTSFASKDSPSSYVQQFLARAQIREGETVFDMGCGTGALALPLARAGHRVIAADFSRGMLDRLEDSARSDTQKLSGKIRTIQMSWEDDWQSFGITQPVADVALASRSIATADLRDSLLRLSQAAKRRACITLPTAASPRSDEKILKELGLDKRRGSDYLYAFNILAAEGFKPEVSYIESSREDSFDSREEAQRSFRRMIDSVLEKSCENDEDKLAQKALAEEREQAYERLEAWLDKNLISDKRAGEKDSHKTPQGILRTRKPRYVTWAFIAWSTESAHS